MARSKKNASLLHPIDTIMHWYAEAQTIPAQLKKNFEGEKDKTLHLIKGLTDELKQAKTLQKKAKAVQVAAIKKAKETSTKVSHALVKKAKAEYQSAAHKVEKLAKEMKVAKANLSNAKVKQKYFHALEAAFMSVTKLFTKKHSALHKKKAAKKRKMVVHHSTAVHRRKKSKASHRKMAKPHRAAAMKSRTRHKKHTSPVRSSKHIIKRRAAHRK